eukprot:COSAG06_NODE_11444_length_1509_cov_1.390071_3_plen_153_part_01
MIFRSQALALLRCPNDHELSVFETPVDGYCCDLCGATVAARHLMQSCRPCEHDVCDDCVQKHNQAWQGQEGQEGQEGQGQPSMLEEVRATTEGAGDFPFDLSSILFEPQNKPPNAAVAGAGAAGAAAAAGGGGRTRKKKQRSSRLIERCVALL